MSSLVSTNVPSLDNDTSRNIAPVHDKVPQIAFYITRLNGHHVPMIPADELPLSVKLENVPRAISFQQAQMLRCVGCAPSSGGLFTLEKDGSSNVQPVTVKNESPPTVNVLPIQSRPWTNPIPSGPNPHRGGNNKNKSNNALPKEPNKEATSSRQRSRGQKMPSKPRSNANNNVLDPKVYCSYWIQHGNCAFKLQGCRYKHIMPDRAELKKIGFTNYPRWWLDANRHLEGRLEPVSHVRASPRPDPNTQEGITASKRSFGNAGTDGGLEEQRKTLKEAGRNHIMPVAPPTNVTLQSSPLYQPHVSLIDLSPSPPGTTSSGSGPLHPFPAYGQRRQGRV